MVEATENREPVGVAEVAAVAVKTRGVDRAERIVSQPISPVTHRWKREKGFWSCTPMATDSCAVPTTITHASEAIRLSLVP